MRLILLILALLIIREHNGQAVTSASKLKAEFINAALDRTLKIQYTIGEYSNHSSLKLFAFQQDQHGKLTPIDRLTIVHDSTTAGDGSSGLIQWHYGKDKLSAGKISIKLVLESKNTVSIEDILKRVNRDSIEKNVKIVYGPRNDINAENLRHKESVKRFMKSHLQRWGYAVTSQDSANLYGHDAENIIARRDGKLNPSQTFILSAHFDTYKKSPGADDNASGIAGMMEVARIFSGLNFQSSIQFVGFDLEENGALGSKFFVWDGGIGKDQHISGVINFDMIGYYSDKPNSQKVPKGFDKHFPEVVARVRKNELKGDFIAVSADSISSPLARAFEAAGSRHVPELKIHVLTPTPGQQLPASLAASDHGSFWAERYSAVHVGDGGDSRNEHINTKDDVLDLLNYEFISNVVKATAATLLINAKADSSSVTDYTFSIE